MPYHIDWIVENRVLYLYLEGCIVGDMVEPLNDTLQASLKNLEQPIYLICNDIGLEKGPSFVDARKFHLPANVDFIFSCNPAPIQRFIGSLVAYLSGTEVQFVTSPDEGLAILAQMKHWTEEETTAAQARLTKLKQQIIT